MRYLALGDSMSIDDYTGVVGGGAASQFARLVGAEGRNFRNLARDGDTTVQVMEAFNLFSFQPEVVTLTVGGNDLLGGDPADVILPRLQRITELLSDFGCPVIVNTVYDPTDGDDSRAELAGLWPELRAELNRLNQGIKEFAADYRLLLSDLEALFHGHGAWAKEPWLVQVIEPNLAGATAMAHHWYALLQNRA